MTISLVNKSPAGRVELLVQNGWIAFESRTMIEIQLNKVLGKWKLVLNHKLKFARSHQESLRLLHKVLVNFLYTIRVLQHECVEQRRVTITVSCVKLLSLKKCP